MRSSQRSATPALTASGAHLYFVLTLRGKAQYTLLFKHLGSETTISSDSGHWKQILPDHAFWVALVPSVSASPAASPSASTSPCPPLEHPQGNGVHSPHTTTLPSPACSGEIVATPAPGVHGQQGTLSCLVLTSSNPLLHPLCTPHPGVDSDF